MLSGWDAEEETVKPIMSPLESTIHRTPALGNTPGSWTCVMILVALIGISFTTALAVASSEIAPLSTDDLQEGATDIVLATVLGRTMVETTNGDWTDRQFSFTIEVEDVLKGSHVRGDRMENISAWNRSWIGSDAPPPSGTGHRPLPLEGEVAKFHLEPAEDGSMQIMLPNGVELSSRADPSDPVRAGEAVVILNSNDGVEAAIEADSKDPFGWDVMLVLLAIPIMVGAMKQPGTARWMLLGFSFLMLGAAVIIVLLR
jgi:hypothetical protein